jgi:hypothetical protein
MSHNFRNLDEFKTAFLQKLWNVSYQSKVRLSTYQNKFHKDHKTTYADHLMRYVIRAKFWTTSCRNRNSWKLWGTIFPCRCNSRGLGHSQRPSKGLFRSWTTSRLHTRAKIQTTTTLRHPTAKLSLKTATRDHITGKTTGGGWAMRMAAISKPTHTKTIQDGNNGETGIVGNRMGHLIWTLKRHFTSHPTCISTTTHLYVRMQETPNRHRRGRCDVVSEVNKGPTIQKFSGHLE